MLYSRRDFGKLALAGVPAAGLLLKSDSAFGSALAKPNSKWAGVQVGMSAVLQRALAYSRCPGFRIVYDEITATYCKARATRSGMGAAESARVISDRRCFQAGAGAR